MHYNARSLALSMTSWTATIGYQRLRVREPFGQTRATPGTQPDAAAQAHAHMHGREGIMMTLREALTRRREMQKRNLARWEAWPWGKNWPGWTPLMVTFVLMGIAIRSWSPQSPYEKTMAARASAQ